VVKTAKIIIKNSVFFISVIFMMQNYKKFIKYEEKKLNLQVWKLITNQNITV
jgi:hypothetical protein